MPVEATPISVDSTYGSLGYVRRILVDESGRYDLVVDRVNYVDNGANKYINDGLQLLDFLSPQPKNQGRRLYTLAADQNTVTMQKLVFIDRVEIYDDDESQRCTLIEKTLDQIRSYSAEDLPSNTGAPLYYALNVIGLAPEQRALGSIAAFDDVDDIVLGAHYIYDGLILYPAADKAYTLQVYGQFLSPYITADNDTCYWFQRNPRAVVHAARYYLERVYQNATGAREWLDDIQLSINGVEKDKIEKELRTSPMQMWG